MCGVRVYVYVYACVCVEQLILFLVSGHDLQEMVMEVLESDVIDCDESRIFEAAAAWVQHPTRSDQDDRHDVTARQALADTVFSVVRFPQVNGNQCMRSAR